MARQTTATETVLTINSSVIDDLDEFTWSCWIYHVALAPLDNPQTSSLLYKTTKNFFMSIALGPMYYFSITTAAGQILYTASTVPVINTWKHITITYQNRIIRMYVDGVLDSGTLADAGGAVTTEEDLNLVVMGNGLSGVNAQTTNGRMSELGIWNRVLTQAEITTLASGSSPVLISDDLVGCWRLYGNSGSVSEPDYSDDNNATLVGTLSNVSNPSDLITRNEVLSSKQLLAASAPSYNRGEIIAQVIEWSGEKTISKLSLYLDLVRDDPSDYIQEENGIASWSALNFQSISDKFAFILYDNDVSEYIGQDDLAVNQGFLSNASTVSYSSSDEAFLVSPYVSYNLYLGSGTYGIWVRSTGSGSFWYSWDDDQTLDEFSLTTDFLWQKMGDFDLENPGFHTLKIYLGSAAAQGIKIDQFVMKRSDYDLNNVDLEGQHITYPLTKAPFNTFVRLRDLNGTSIRSLASTTTKGWSWLSSNKINSSDWYNYGINNIVFSEGLSIEFIVISGNADFNAQWNYSPSDFEMSYISTNYGQSFTQE